MLLKRYFNLINKFSNWSEYFRYKKDNRLTIKLITRKRGIEIPVSKASMGVFKEIFLHDFYNIKLLKRIIGRSPLIIDIGANIGYFTLLANDIINPERILCFEPIPNNFRLLLKNLEFDKQGINISCQLAVGKTGVNNIEMFLNPLAVCSITASKYENISQGKEKIICEAIDLEQIINQNKLKKIDLLKMDCEGSEYDIFYSLNKKYFDIISAVAMEVHEIDTESQNLNSLLRFLSGYNYKVKTRHINEQTSMLWAWR